MDLLASLEKIRNPFLTYIFRMFTEIGGELVVIAIICAIYWCYNKKLAYYISFGLFLSSLAVQGLKITFRIPRPWVRYPSLNPIGEVIKTATGYSFPSGHTQATTALYAALALKSKRSITKIGCAVVIIGVGFSRMYLGMHTLQDVMASFLITMAVVIIIHRISKVTLTKRQRLMIAILVGAASIGLLTYSLILNHQDIIAAEFASDSCQAAFAGLGVALGWYIENQYIQFSVKTKDSRTQIVKYLIGIGIAIGIKLLTKFTLPDVIIVDGITNFVLVLWILIGYPMIFSRFLSKKE